MFRSLGYVSRCKESPSQNRITPPSARLEIVVESPPLVCYGSPSDSAGALFSGRLRVTVARFAGEVILNQLDICLISKATIKRPVRRSCKSCAVRVDEITRWDFLTNHLTLTVGDHDFPFSYLFPGHMPATYDGPFSKIEYILLAHAQSTGGGEFSFELPLDLSRALFPGSDQSLIRLFPPTKLITHLVLPSAIHPIGKFPVKLVLGGIVNSGCAIRTHWRLHSVRWRIEEHQKIIQIACERHSGKMKGESNRIPQQEMRIIGSKEEKSGWKADIDNAAGEISVQFEVSINPINHLVCDMEVPDVIEVKHKLEIQLTMTEEIYGLGKNSLSIPTGTARVLRANYDLTVTERCGLGVSWDEEVPPTYDTIADSPPDYTRHNKSKQPD